MSVKQILAVMKRQGNRDVDRAVKSILRWNPGADTLEFRRAVEAVKVGIKSGP